MEFAHDRPSDLHAMCSLSNIGLNLIPGYSASKVESSEFGIEGLGFRFLSSNIPPESDPGVLCVESLGFRVEASLS